MLAFLRIALRGAAFSLTLSLAACVGTSRAPDAEPAAPPLTRVGFDALPGWSQDDLSAAWPAFIAGCGALQTKAEWREVCTEAKIATPQNTQEARRFFETRFDAYQLRQPDGKTEGLITGYYEPLLRGSRVRKAPYVHPLYRVPEDLIVVDLAAVTPETKSLRLRGRVEGRRLVPYHSRAEIDGERAPLAGKELVWVDDAIEAFFLQVQGSGRVQLEEGGRMRVGYADQNGHPYQSIGRILVERGELQLSEASMQSIQQWARTNPERLTALLNENPSYVFFRELSHQEGGPLGALNVPLTPERSIAIDPRHIPLGAPVFLSTDLPDGAAIRRLVFAQDTGGAIRGVVRGDYFCGFGAEAGALAGRMRQQGAMWVLLPKGYPQAQAAERTASERPASPR